MQRVDRRLRSEVQPPLTQQHPVGGRLVVRLQKPVKPGGRVPVDDVGAVVGGAERLIRDEAEIDVAAAADDDLATVDAGLGVLQRLG